MKLRWTQRARRDLVEIGRHVARDKPMAAQAWKRSSKRGSPPSPVMTTR
jgi:plasmid stabilization system protein ParE